MTPIAKRALGLLVSGVSLLATGMLMAAGALPDEPAVVTPGEVHLPGGLLTYSAETGRIAIRDAETGVPHGYMFYTAYRVPSQRPRPIAFVWNGGPGANSALLHFEAAGPWRYADGGLVPNADTWLTAMDLVFVDPVGTGFSRPAKAEYADAFYGTVGDVASVTEFVRAWRLLHAAERAPLLLVGESWGAGRAGSVGYRLVDQGLPVRALVLISGGAGLNDDPLPRPLAQALRVVDRAATALYHGRLSADLGRSADAVRARAERWARETYAPALERADALSDDERDAIVTGLARFTGLPPDAIDRAALTVSPRAFRERLLSAAPEGPARRLDVFDMRLVADAAPTGTAERDPGRRTVIPRYLRHQLGYTTALPYVGLEPLEDAYAPGGTFPPTVNERWNYATADVTPEQVQAAIQAAVKQGDGPPRLGPPLPSAAEAVRLDPQLKVLVAAGRYDSLNSCAANAERPRYLPPELRAAYTFACFEGGHMMYRDARARTDLARRMRALAAVTGSQRAD